MALKVDYYTLLLRSVHGLDRHAYAARGAVYEREYKTLLKLLFSASPRRSQVEIESEQQAFHDAIRRIEFGDDGRAGTLHTSAPEAVALAPAAPVAPVRPVAAPVAAAPPAPVRPAAAPVAAASANRVRAAPAPLAPENVIPSPVAPAWPRSPEPDNLIQPEIPEEHPQEYAPAALEPDAYASADPGEAHDPAAVKRRRTPLAGLLVRRALLGAVLLGLGAIAYGHATGGLDLPWLSLLTGDGSQLGPANDKDAQRAIVYDGAVNQSNESKAAGKAVWRIRSEGADQQGGPATVVRIDVEIPARKIILSVSLRREGAGSPMSHLMELRFQDEDGRPDSTIVDLGAIYGAAEDLTGRGALLGRAEPVAPGVFLFGFAGMDADKQQNARFLKEMAWLVIPLRYRNGAFGALAVEKGAPGGRVIDEALAKWGR